MKTLISKYDGNTFDNTFDNTFAYIKNLKCTSNNWSVAVVEIKKLKWEKKQT